ncbi:MAG: DUF1552 domain-containing protein [Polyangiales bacterium]
MGINKSSRRDFFRNAALATVALPFIRALNGEMGLEGLARADGMANPKRIIFHFVPNGIRDWSDYAIPGSSPTDFTLGSMLTPLQSLKDQLILTDGLEMRHDGFDGSTHVQGTVMFLTAKHMKLNCNVHDEACLNAGGQYGPSIDQYLAQQLGKKVTPQWPSIALGVQQNYIPLGYANDGSALPPNNNPYDVFMKMFAGLADGTKAPDPALVTRQQLRKSVLDRVAGDIGNLRGRLGAEDRARCDQHLDNIRNMELRLAGGGATVGATCKKPALAPGVDLSRAPNTPAASTMQLDVLYNALACDLTRVATLQYRGVYTPLTFPFAPVNNDKQSLHAMSHDTPANLITAKRWHYQELANFAQRLKATPEGSGTMLDNTLIFSGSEIGIGHTHERMPFFLIGGKNMGMKTGRYLNYAAHTPHCKLLTSILNAMGLPDTQFGNTSYGTGPLEGLTG